jgi:hypothetical protein
MTPKPHTYVADIAQLPKALQRITLLKRWVVWRWELRTKKNGDEAWTKPPYQCSYPKVAAKSNDPSTWGSYADAVAAVTAGLADGIGFMLKDSEVAAADLDHVRDAQTGELVGWAKGLCAEADSLGLYREVTVSGCGFRLLGLSPQGNELHRKFTFNRKSGAGIELYRMRALHHHQRIARGISLRGLKPDRRLPGCVAGAFRRAAGVERERIRFQHRWGKRLLPEHHREWRSGGRAQRKIPGSRLAPCERRLDC